MAFDPRSTWAAPSQPQVNAHVNTFYFVSSLLLSTGATGHIDFTGGPSYQIPKLANHYLFMWAAGTPIVAFTVEISYDGTNFGGVANFILGNGDFGAAQQVTAVGPMAIPGAVMQIRYELCNTIGLPGATLNFGLELRAMP